MKSQVNKKPVSAVVVAYNESHLIGDCLESLAFCDEIILIDLGSQDETVNIAKSYGAKILKHPWVPIGEQARQFGLSRAKHDWVVVIDPDERVSKALPEQLLSAIEKNANIGMVAVRWKFFFKNKELTTTRWGYVKKVKPVFFHKSRVVFGTEVHSPCLVKEGFLEYRIPYDGSNFLVHLWVSNFFDLLKKHWKYIAMEGEVQYCKGNRFSWKKLLIEPARDLKKNLWNQEGIKGGPVGIFLSFFWAWYLAMRELSLANYQFKKGEKSSLGE